MTDPDPTISPHEPPNEDIAAQLFVMSNPNHAVGIGEYWEICERAAIRIRELEAANALLTEKLADREQEAAARYTQWHEAYTNLRTVGAENKRLREALKSFARLADKMDGKGDGRTRIVVEYTSDGMRIADFRRARAALNSTGTALATAECDGGKE